MDMKKNLVSAAVTTALGLGVAGAATADTVIDFVIEDVGSTVNGVNGGGGTFATALDQNSGGFRFGNINPETYKSVFGWTGDAGTGTMLAEGNANATGSFSTGFIFSSTPFVPFTFGSGVNADITANNMTFGSLDFGGAFQSALGTTDFFLPPDTGTLFVNWVEDGASATEKLVSFQWSHLITTAEDSSGNFTGFNARWIVEGTATVVPVPAAVWLFGSGVIGLAGIARRRKSKS